MTHPITNSLAAIAAMLITITSIGTIVAVPPANAHIAATPIAISELA